MRRDKTQQVCQGYGKADDDFMSSDIAITKDRLLTGVRHSLKWTPLRGLHPGSVNPVEKATAVSLEAGLSW